MSIFEKHIEKIERPTDLSNDDVYLTLQLRNTNDYGTIEAYYDETRTQSLLTLPSDKYKIAMTNLSIPMTQTYLNIWPFPTDISNASAYSVTLALYDNTLGGPVIKRKWLQPVPYVTTDQPKMTRVFLYNQYMISANNALQSAFDDIVSSIPNYIMNNNYPQSAPKMVCETNSSLFYIVADYRCNADSNNSEASINPASSAAPNGIVLQISFNHAMNRLFQNFPSVNIGFDVPDPIDGRSVILRIYDQGYASLNNTLIYYNTLTGDFYNSQSLIPAATGTIRPQYYKVYQQESTTGLLSNVESIVVTTSVMDIGQAFYNPFKIDPITNEAIDTGSSARIKLLHPPIPLNINSFENSESNSQFIWYEQGEFRWNNITTSIPFKRLNFTINLYSRGGQLYPVLIEPNQDAYITLLFRAK